MNILTILALSLVLSVSAYARFEALGRYEADNGSLLSLEYSDFEKAPVLLYIVLGADTKFDYLRMAQILLSAEDYKKLFEVEGNFELTGDDTQSITGQASVDAEGVRKIEMKLTQFSTEKKVQVNSVQDFVIEVRQGVVSAISVESQKRNNGFLLSYGLKKVYECSAQMTQTQAGLLLNGQLLTEEAVVARVLGL